jgi:hypothetical protein
MCVPGFEKHWWQLDPDFLASLGGVGYVCLRVADDELIIKDETRTEYGPFDASCLDFDHDGRGDGYRVRPFGQVEVTRTKGGWHLDALVFRSERRETDVFLCEEDL